MEEKFDFGGLIKSIEEYILTIELNSNDMLQVNRILYKLRNIEAIANSIDESFFSSLIENDYNNLKKYCNNFTSGQHSNYLSNMQTATNNIANGLLVYIDFNMLLGNKTGIKENIKYYKNELAKQNSIIGNETSQFIDDIKAKKTNLQNEDSKLNQMFSKFNTKLEQLEKEQSQLNNNIGNLLKETNDKIDNLIEKEKTKLEENYNNEVSNYKNKFDEAYSNYDTNFQKLENEYLEKYEILYNEIKEKDNKISKLLDIVGDKARIGEYKKNADLLRKERIFWQVLTIFLFLVAFGILMYVTLNTKDYDKYTVIKYIVSVILMGAATYTGKQASNSRKDEVYYRKQELELSSIDVYLENMDSNSKDEIKKELSSRLFGQAQNTYTNKYDERKAFSTDDIIKIIEVLKNSN